VVGLQSRARAIWRLPMQPTTIIKMRDINSGRFCQYEVEKVCVLK
jgi:hypothetical protein